MRVHHVFMQGSSARPWLVGATVALLAAFTLAGCDPSALGLGTTACTPQTCDYVVSTLTAVANGSSDTVLADAQASDGNNYLYQYSGSAWTKVGQETASARGDGLFASPNFAKDNTLFLGNSVSTSGGKTWSPLCVTVKGVSPNFASDHTVFGVDAKPVSTTPAATPTGTVTTTATPAPTVNCPSATGSYYISTDSGTTWTAVQGPSGAGDPDVFAISPTYSSDKTIFADFTVNLVTALYKSTDNGQTWKQVLSQRQAIIAVSPNFASDSTVIAVSNSKIQRSTDGGNTWSGITAPITADQVAEVTFSPNFAQDKTAALISAAVDSGSTAAHGTYISTDGGSTWAQTGSVTQRGLNQPAFLFSPNYATNKTAYTASEGQGQGPASSTDQGKTWTTFNSGLDLQAGLGG
jgi:photosystem II stability/assembly factor-like uncharacterized protein